MLNSHGERALPVWVNSHLQHTQAMVSRHEWQHKFAKSTRLGSQYAEERSQGSQWNSEQVEATFSMTGQTRACSYKTNWVVHMETWGKEHGCLATAQHRSVSTENTQ